VRYRNPDATWIFSPNFWANRNGADMAIPPAWVVLHTVVGTLDGAVRIFQDWSQQKSAHYVVGEDGRLVQLVDEGDAAWHAGTQYCNENSVGIEHEDMGQPNSPRPDALYTTSARLVRGICLRYGIPIAHGNFAGKVSGIVPHREVFQTGCPDTLDVDRIIREAATGGDDMTKDDVRAVLDEGTAFGFSSWKETNQHMANILRGLEETGVTAKLDALKTEIDAIKAEVEAGGSPDAASAIARVEAALKSA
jgi:hypothetical protein